MAVEVRERLVGGALNDVVRVGSTVHRSTGPWRATVHHFLHFLHDHGFHAAPRPLGVDAHGREVVTHLPGRAVVAPLQPPDQTDALLADLATLLRHYHDVSTTYVPPGRAVWRRMPGAPRSGDVIGHNDLSTDNIVVAGVRPVGLIDFEFAAPAPRLLDVAALALAWVPLGDPARHRRLGWDATADRAGRLRLLSEAYGLDARQRAALLDHVALRLRIRAATHVRLQRTVDGFHRLVRAGSLRDIGADECWLRDWRAVLETALAGPRSILLSG